MAQLRKALPPLAQSPIAEGGRHRLPDIVWKFKIAAGDFALILHGEPAGCGVF
jgi:hypothetical protein